MTPVKGPHFQPGIGTVGYHVGPFPAFDMTDVHSNSRPAAAEGLHGHYEVRKREDRAAPPVVVNTRMCSAPPYPHFNVDYSFAGDDDVAVLAARFQHQDGVSLLRVLDDDCAARRRPNLLIAVMHDHDAA